MHGIPNHWEVVEQWLDEDLVPVYPEKTTKTLSARKYDSIPMLQDYSVPPSEVFWDKFPKRDLPAKAETKISAVMLNNLAKGVDGKLSKSELKRAAKVVKDLAEGADSYQKSSLPPITVPNARSALEHGALITDKVASWVDSGFVAGPFDYPPVPGFRANPLMAVVRNGKVRPVLNMSSPDGFSFNDNVEKAKLEKVHMDTARKFGHTLKEAGKDAVFSKFDFCDAYKTIPAKPEDYRLQGFRWLGKYFVETQQTFGGIPSVCNFDREGNTVKVVTSARSNVPRNWILRILDDTSVIGPKWSGYSESFSKEMRNVCELIGMPLAPICPNREKAFENETRGVVMGVGFDSTNLSWFLPKEKAERTIRRCLEIYNAKHVDLKQLEKVMGSVNDLAQLAEFAKFYKNSGYQLLSQFQGDYNILKPVQRVVKDDMLVLAKIALSSIAGLPIPSRPCGMPLSALEFYTDAAGASYTLVNGVRHYHSNEHKGVACVAGSSKDDIWCWTRLEWYNEFLLNMRDSKGKFYGSKSTTLECIGLILPFVSFPELICGRFVCFYIDNIAVKYGWENGYVKFDESATEILKCVNILACFLGVHVVVKHVPRMTGDLASLADILSRKPSHEWAKSHLFRDPGLAVTSWLKNPELNGSLWRAVYAEIKQKMPYL